MLKSVPFYRLGNFSTFYESKKKVKDFGKSDEDYVWDGYVNFELILDPRWKRTGSYEFGVVIVNASQSVSEWVSEWVSQLVS